jgi:AcrR family transcriptional regulator
LRGRWITKEDKGARIFEALTTLAEDSSKQFNFSIADVATAAKVGKSAIYEQFSNKDELMSAAYRYYVENFIAVLNTSNREGVSFQTSVFRLYEAIQTQVVPKLSVFLSMFGSLPLDDDLREEFDEAVACLIHIGIREGLISSQTTKQEFLAAFVAGACLVAWETKISKEDSYAHAFEQMERQIR